MNAKRGLRLATDAPLDPSGIGVQLLTAEQVGALLNIKRKRVYELPIAVVRLGPRTLRWKRHDVDMLVASRIVR